jgi:hypothetical protein
MPLFGAGGTVKRKNAGQRQGTFEELFELAMQFRGGEKRNWRARPDSNL